MEKLNNSKLKEFIKLVVREIELERSVKALSEEVPKHFGSTGIQDAHIEAERNIENFKWD